MTFIDIIKIIKFPGSTLNVNELPKGAVALDGAVQGPLMGDEKDRWSFDHHDGCVRLITASTCEQVRTAICLGFSFEGRQVVVNDLDGDTLMSLWLIKNPGKANQDRVRSLVRAVGTVDAHGPAGNLLLANEEKRLATAFYHGAIKPVTDLRGKVREVFDQWDELIKTCHEGISDLVAHGPRVEEPPPPPVKILHTGEIGPHRAVMAECDEFGGFDVLYGEGFDIIVLCREAADGTTTYTVAKRSDLVRFPLGPGGDERSLIGRLNAREEGWGGGSSIGGSPRLEGGRSSSLKPEEVWQEVVTS